MTVSRIFRHAVMLVIISSVAMLGLFAAVYWNDQRDRQYHELNQHYHLGSLKHVAVINEAIQSLKLWHLAAGDGKYREMQPGIQAQNDLNVANEIDLIVAEADRLQALQRRYAVSQFESLSARLQKSMEVFRHRPAGDVPAQYGYVNALEPLLVELQQLERLHQILLEERVAAEAVRKQRDRVVTIVAVFCILLCSAALIGYFLRQVRTALVRQQQAEDRLQNINTRLDQRVRERTGELEDARDEAERANRAKSEFLSRMSHELRTPMNAVLGAAQLLEYTGDQLDSKQRRYVELIKSGGGHLLELINEVLDLARIESGNYELQLEPVSIGLLVQECIGLLGPIIKSRQLHLENHIDTDDDYITADPKCLRQVLLNLMSNAVKYNRDGGKIMLYCDRNTPGRIRLGVSDTGPGITAADQSHIFQPFNRLHTDAHVEGSGIGLAVSKELVELMGGELTVDSHPGEGSTFWIELNTEGAGRDTGMRETSPGGVSGKPRATAG